MTVGELAVVACFTYWCIGDRPTAPIYRAFQEIGWFLLLVSVVVSLWYVAGGDVSAAKMLAAIGVGGTLGAAWRRRDAPPKVRVEWDVWIFYYVPAACVLVGWHWGLAWVAAKSGHSATVHSARGVAGDLVVDATLFAAFFTASQMSTVRLQHHLAKSLQNDWLVAEGHPDRGKILLFLMAAPIAVCIVPSLMTGGLLTSVLLRLATLGTAWWLTRSASGEGDAGFLSCGTRKTAVALLHRLHDDKPSYAHADALSETSAAAESDPGAGRSPSPSIRLMSMRRTRKVADQKEASPLARVEACARELDRAREGRDQSIAEARRQGASFRQIASVSRVQQIAAAPLPFGPGRSPVTEVDLFLRVGTSEKGDVDEAERVFSLQAVAPWYETWETEREFIASSPERAVSANRYDLSHHVDLDPTVTWTVVYISETREVYAFQNTQLDVPGQEDEMGPAGSLRSPCVLLGHAYSYRLISAALDTPLLNISYRPGGLAFVFGRLRLLNRLLGTIAGPGDSEQIWRYLEGLLSEERR